MFIPRKDWLTYLTYDMAVKPPEHNDFMENIYQTDLSEEHMLIKYDVYLKIRNWMDDYMKRNQWF
jgi:hypothetical protein